MLFKVQATFTVGKTTYCFEEQKDLVFSSFTTVNIYFPHSCKANQLLHEWLECLKVQ